MEFRASGCVNNTWMFRESGNPGEGIEVLHPFPVSCPNKILPSHLAVPELYLL